MAVTNVTSAYGYFAQIGDLESWKCLFAPDARFLMSTTPGSPANEIPLNEIFEVETRGFADARRLHENPFAGETRLYLSGPLFFREQTPESIKSVFNVFGIRVHPDTPTPRIEWTALYKADFSKAESQWKIAYWEVLMHQRIEVLAAAPKDL